jgi:aromatic amino acid aminotransferase I / 2-aminoadipate transaminase
MAPHAEPEALTDTSTVVLNDPVLSSGDTHAVFTLDDVLPHRQTSKPPSTGIAAFSEADMFKSKGAFKKPKAKRWDHRLSSESKARTASSLKGAMKYFKADTISLCGGLPSRYVPSRFC